MKLFRILNSLNTVSLIIASLLPAIALYGALFSKIYESALCILVILVFLYKIECRISENTRINKSN